MTMTIHNAPVFHEPSSQMSFEQCAKEINILLRASLRDYGRTIEIFRELEDKEQDLLVRQKVQTYRSIVPTIMRIGIVVLNIATIGTNLLPAGVKNSYDWLTKNVPDIFSREHYKSLSDAANNFKYAQLTKLITGSLDAGQRIVQTGLDIHKNSEEAERTDLDARYKKAQELETRRTKEAQERRAQSDELLQLIQQLNRSFAEAIQGLARH